MTIENKKFIEEHVNKRFDEEVEFELVLEKLNEVFAEILNEVCENTNNSVSFKLNLLGEHFLGTNYAYFNHAHILIDYFTSESDYEYTKNREKKGAIGKLYSDAFNFKNNLVPTISEMTQYLYKQLTLKLKNANITTRNNQIYLTFLGYRFFIFFVNNYNLNNEYNFNIRAKNFNFNLELLNKNLIQKNEETNGNFFKLVKMFRVSELELSLLNKVSVLASKTPFLYENLLYNVPNSLLNNEYVYDNFLSSVSYLTSVNLNDLKTADNQKLVNDDYKLRLKPSVTTYDIKKVLKQTTYFINNIELTFQPNKKN